MASLDPKDLATLLYDLCPVRRLWPGQNECPSADMPEGTKPQLIRHPTGSRRLGLSLRFISGKYEGGEFPLENDKDIVVGRSSELDMVLVEEMVSRRHAKITVHAGKITIEDLGSTNGTFVNGERIQNAELHEGDRILIGTSILKVVPETPMGSDSRSNVKPIAPGVRKGGRHRPGSLPGGSDEAPRMTGHLEEVPLPDLLQLFSTSRKSGVLVLHHEGKVGRIMLDNGRIHFALIEEQPEVLPFKCIYRMMEWQTGFFELEPPDSMRYKGALDAAVPEILMEVLRQQDEMTTVKHKLPPMESSLQLKTPMAAPLNELEPRQLDVLQMALNSPNVSALFERSKYSDLDTARILVELLTRGYLQASGK
ncbi:MAG TPA: FHA domain-containing protein [Polyangiaceae bacterium]|nr:FHA domain-containing protein [Polyangiaceae bacterium]